MSLDVVTLALAKSYTDQHGGGGSVGDITAEDVAYTYPNQSWTNAKQGLDEIMVSLEAFAEIIGGLGEASHTHANKSALDKFGETDGKPTYNGEALGGGVSDFIIKMTVESDRSGNYTVTSCDATFEQINAAYNADKNIVLKVAASGYQGDGSYSLPVVSAAPGSFYYFCGLDDLYVYLAFFGPDYSEFSASNLSANNITYSNTALPNVKNVKAALDKLLTDSHTHANKDTLDKLSVSNGKLQYNGSDVGLKGDKGDTGPAGADGYTPVKGTDYWTPADTAEIVDELKPSQVTSGTSMTLADNTEYRLTDVTELTITYPNGNFECWMRLAFATEGAITVTLPATTQYIGTTPAFANGETWELSIKDGIVIAGKVA